MTYSSRGTTRSISNYEAGLCKPTPSSRTLRLTTATALVAPSGYGCLDSGSVSSGQMALRATPTRKPKPIKVHAAPPWAASGSAASPYLGTRSHHPNVCERLLIGAATTFPIPACCPYYVPAQHNGAILRMFDISAQWGNPVLCGTPSTHRRTVRLFAYPRPPMPCTSTPIGG
ncbi:hypothetical protein COCSADRAFT_26956 [Bipolaris sorokiniana ND90Pr]|uniref:Uncharacterized protein n=1 Tax=Cochliobolus sativus (strain ND90Pr / ATCC 201652) TaxID=665912 RepID=M2SMV0_COCSN|nr:uncharacterized protein COCSADRAFT_26956 [Bipolaris sorokiniana ND90Pr]EMD63615.1 hypothetical protein COCSADRAFT_26956 [Bipolaris sorokiniana ND90Pr]